jgi:isopentenyl diphosphate isomerase/L-lactate dehydrogenase-like FMN-dependent dehydrogenase
MGSFIHPLPLDRQLSLRSTVISLLLVKFVVQQEKSIIADGGIEI